ncbi:glycosyltransferase family 2 protein [Flavobacterium aquariorum]|uniref:Glycosyltransferase family 2 protein n=1 Tax=Flavobacterium aquariorum TaxID=2217670 RepID=A0A2W7TZA4_9FLAO|nr:glycosyltransferase family 2 protein [Flavobacterium aquariorum]PZX94834.1 glycosyltransferase family 2 protein [Flavobacterium aquariorum]
MKTSVAMCTYNGEKYIKEQLESIFNQTVAIDEIIICDDGSNDKTITIIELIQIENPNKISLYKNQINLGSTKNFEKAIEFCSGDYIFLSDQDDIWKENKVEKVIQHFFKNPSTEAVFTNGDLFNGENKKIETHSLWDSVFFMENQLSKPIDLYQHILFKANMVTGATLCIKKEIKKLILPIPNIKKFYHDEWIAIVIASRNNLEYLTDKLISYRIHSSQQSGISSNLKISKSKKYQLKSNHILGHDTPNSFQEHSQLAKLYFRNYLKFKTASKEVKNDFPVNFNEIAETYLDLFKKCNESLKKANPIFYFFRNLTDKMRGKRQLN